MALVDRLKKRNAEARVAGKHPLTELGADLNVRTAYFQGLALVAFVDDGKVDANERTYLQKLGVALGMSGEDVSSTIDQIAKFQGDEDQQEALVADIVSTVTDSVMRKLFLAELTCLSTVHDHEWNSVHDLRSAFADMMDCDLEALGFKAFDEVLRGLPKTVGKIPSLENLFSQPMLDYLFPGYADLLEKETEKQREAAQKEIDEANAKLKDLDDYLLSLCEGAFPEKLDVQVIRKKFAFAGVTEHFQTTLLRRILPYAKKALKKFDDEIWRTTYDRRDSTDSIIELEQHETAKALRNYCRLFDIITFKDQKYCIVLPTQKSKSPDHLGIAGTLSAIDVFYSTFPGSKKDKPNERNVILVSNGRVDFNEIKWSWRSKDGEQDAKKASIEMFETILAEFEFRAGW